MSRLLLILVCLQDAYNQWLLRRFTRLALPPVAAQQLFLTSTLIVFYSHFQVFLQITTYGILPRLLRFRYKWRQLHELQLPDRRSWSVYPSFSFRILLLTILNTAATQVLGKGKRKDLEGESLSCRKYRNKILDGLMVQ